MDYLLILTLRTPASMADVNKQETTRNSGALLE